MNIELIAINKLKPATYNPRQISTKQYKDLKESIERFDLVDPIIINKDFTIIGGHQRYKICKELKHKEIDCVVLDLSKEEERELNIRLNKSGGEFDMDILANEFDITELKDWGFLDTDFGFNIDKIIDNAEEDEEIEIPQSLQIEPPKEYIIIITEPNSVEWEELKEELKLQIVRKGGYKKGSPYDESSIERVLTYSDFKKRYAHSNTK